MNTHWRQPQFTIGDTVEYDEPNGAPNHFRRTVGEVTGIKIAWRYYGRKREVLTIHYQLSTSGLLPREEDLKYYGGHQ